MSKEELDFLMFLIKRGIDYVDFNSAITVSDNGAFIARIYPDENKYIILNAKFEEVTKYGLEEAKNYILQMLDNFRIKKLVGAIVNEK